MSLFMFDFYHPGTPAINSIDMLSTTNTYSSYTETSISGRYAFKRLWTEELNTKSSRDQN